MKYDNFVNLDPSQSKINNRDPLDFAIKKPSIKSEIGEIFSKYYPDGTKQQKETIWVFIVLGIYNFESQIHYGIMHILFTFILFTATTSQQFHSLSTLLGPITNIHEKG